MMEIHGGTLITPGREPRQGEVLCAEGRIEEVRWGKTEFARSKKSPLIDASGLWVIPGFIDLHTHGAAGASVMEGTEEAVREFAAAKVREGVTTFLPTTWTASEGELVKAIEGVTQYQARMDFARAPGVHVEGPYLNPECLGAQNPAWARLPDLDEMRRVCEAGEVMIVSLAAELEGAAEVIEWLSHQGIIPSLAHSAATFHEVMSAKESGLRHFTHLCNQMTGVHHREIGAVGAGLLDADLRMEVIPDGIHLCPEMLALLFRLVDRERIMVITDSISASGLSDGTYEEGGQEVLVRDGICRLPSGALAGSTLAYPKAISVLEEAIGEPFAQFVETTSWNQARSCGWTDVGKIEQGFRADFALLDPSDHRVIRTIVAGKEVYKAF